MSERGNIQVIIHCNVTGEVRLYEHPDYDEGRFEPYIWGGGNYSCDCNRGLFFARAAGEPDPDDRECGEERYTILGIFQRGRLVYGPELDAGAAPSPAELWSTVRVEH